MVDPTLNLEKIGQQIRIIQGKFAKLERWAAWARDLIIEHSNTIHRLEREKAALVDACEAAKALLAEAQSISYPNNGFASVSYIEQYVAKLDSAIAQAKGD